MWMKHLLKNQTKNLPQTTQHKEEFFNKGSNCTCKFFKEATLQIYNTILLTDGFRIIGHDYKGTFQGRQAPLLSTALANFKEEWNKEQHENLRWGNG